MKVIYRSRSTQNFIEVFNRAIADFTGPDINALAHRDINFLMDDINETQKKDEHTAILTKLGQIYHRVDELPVNNHAAGVAVYGATQSVIYPTSNLEAAFAKKWQAIVEKLAPDARRDAIKYARSELALHPSPRLAEKIREVEATNGMSVKMGASARRCERA